MRFALLLLLLLVLAAPAEAAMPRFGVFNLDADLAKASRNEFGDVRVARRPGALSGVVVRCGSGCRFGSGWLAFAKRSSLSAADVAGATARAGRLGWSVDVRLTAHGRARWTALSTVAARHLRSHGVPDVLVVVVDGSIVAAPFANQVRAKAGSLELVGFHRADARRAANLLRQ